jgi:hypothetical protein
MRPKTDAERRLARAICALWTERVLGSDAEVLALASAWLACGAEHGLPSMLDAVAECVVDVAAKAPLSLRGATRVRTRR